MTTLGGRIGMKALKVVAVCCGTFSAFLAFAGAALLLDVVNPSALRAPSLN